MYQGVQFRSTILTDASKYFEIALLLLHSPPINVCWSSPGLLNKSISAKEKIKLEGDIPQDKERKELLKKYRKANEL